MDISSLLSPQESTEGSPPAKAQTPATLRREPSSTATVISRAPLVSSPLHQAVAIPPTLSHSAIVQAQHVLPSPPIISPNTGKTTSAKRTPTPSTDGRPSGSRQPSTPGMDTLADLASMQHHQQAARVSASGLRSAEVFDSPTQQSPVAQAYPPLHALPRSTGRPAIDLAMPDATPQTPPPKPFVSASLSELDLQTIAQLDSHVWKNPYAYASHTQLIQLLHKGFVSHIHASDRQTPKPDPRGYELLEDLRAAREAMQVRFPVGEDLWADWIHDESVLSRTIEDRVAVMELCRRAVSEELGSPKLWLLYGNWMSSLYTATHPDAPPSMQDNADPDAHASWTDEEKVVGAEVFDWGTVMGVWSRAAKATEWWIHDSHLAWDRYAAILMDELERSPAPERIRRLKALFEERLRIPHTRWEQTFQSFSTFITRYDNAAYEQTMIDTSKQGARAKALLDLRAPFEQSIEAAAKADDKAAEWRAFTDYLEWEVAQSMGRKKTGGVILCNAVYERATLRFASDASLWEDYLFFLVEKASTAPNVVPLVPVIQRATRHCPWSGTLWSQYLLSCERENQPFHEIEEVKHTATSTGLMDIGGMDEVLKVHTAWCGYLNRRAFHDKATDEEADVAEVGIRSALESVRDLGEKKYGKEYNGDPTYRLERIYIEYLSHSGQWERGRKEVWQVLAPSRGDSYEFWVRWYQWEMICWSRLFANATTSGAGLEKRTTTAHEATAVLRQALKRKDLDWPEKILEVYLHHAEDHESVEEVQRAMIVIRKITRGVAKRREREAAEAAALQQRQAEQERTAEDDVDESPGRQKRKRDVESEAADGTVSKKHRAEEAVAASSLSEPSALKRDRENTTVIIKNLPADVSGTKVRQFFRDCGEIMTLRLTPDTTGDSATATIEFDSKEDVLSAQTRDMKTFEGRTIEVQVGTGSTLFVTNFPPTADETYIRDLFRDDGEIVDVRFPSLKYNTHRRFCYVQFRSSQQAKTATEKDGRELKGGKLKLVAKISDPAHKQDRTGALYDGREVYVSNVDWTATVDEMKQIFSKYGTVERVRIPTNLAGKSKGIAFVVFSSKDEATSALDMNLTKFKSRVLNVTLSTANPAKRQATTIIAGQRSSTSPTPESHTDKTEPVTNGHLPDTSPSPAPSNPSVVSNDSHRPSNASIQARTLALLNVPDTINDSRIRALVEPYGSLTKITLRPDHRGAIIEFTDTQSAGKASLGVEGHEILPGRRIRVGTVRELLGEQAEVRASDKIVIGSGAGTKMKKSDGTLQLQVGAPIRRPQIGRRGGKGGLGFKRGGGGLGGDRARTGAGPTTDENGPPASDGATGKKSNADFRAMFTSSS